MKGVISGRRDKICKDKGLILEFIVAGTSSV